MLGDLQIYGEKQSLLPRSYLFRQRGKAWELFISTMMMVTQAQINSDLELNLEFLILVQSFIFKTDFPLCIVATHKGADTPCSKSFSNL